MTPTLVAMAASTPTNTDQPKSTCLSQLNAFLAANPSVNFIRCQWIDFGAIVRCFMIPTAYALDLAAKGQDGGLNVVKPVVCMLAPGDVMDASLLESGDDRLIPDWSSLLVCGYHKTHASVMCWVEGGTLNGPTTFAQCPRNALARQIERAKKRHDGLEFLVGLEVEFLIFDPNERKGEAPPPMVGCGIYSTAYLTARFLPVIDEIAMTLQRAGIKVMKINAEDGPLGMFEISLCPLAPIEAADALVFCHETIRHTCIRYDLKGTVHPAPYEKSLNLGAHVHLSMEGEAKEEEEAFLSGMLSSMRGIAAFTMPNYDSCERKSRLKDWIRWGTRNKTCTVRKMRKGYWEIRCVDGTANIYLALASLLSAGLTGIEEELELTIRDHQETRFGAGPTEEERRDLGITEMLPNHLAEALTALDADQALKDGLCRELVESYVRLKRKEEAAMRNMGGAARRETSMRWF